MRDFTQALLIPCGQGFIQPQLLTSNEISRDESSPDQKSPSVSSGTRFPHSYLHLMELSGWSASVLLILGAWKVAERTEGLKT